MGVKDDYYFIFQRVTLLERLKGCKTKRLHWFNFGLHRRAVEAYKTYKRFTLGYRTFTWGCRKVEEGCLSLLFSCINVTEKPVFKRYALI